MTQSTIDISSLLEENTLSNEMKKNIFKKLYSLITLIETIQNIKFTEQLNPTLESAEITEQTVLKEIKATAKLIVKKSTSFSKKTIEMTLKQKEEAIELLEVSKLRIEAQIKELQKRENALIMPKENIFVRRLKNFFNFLHLNRLTKDSTSSLSLDKKIKNYNSKLSDFETQKNKITENFCKTGSTKLAQLREQTYSILSNSSIAATREEIEKLKSKILKKSI